MILLFFEILFLSRFSLENKKQNLNDFKSRLFYPGFCFYFYFSKGVTQINRKVFPQKVYFGGFTAFAFFSRVV
jgi:hypothetical protein